LPRLSPIAFWRFNETSGNVAFDSFGTNHATYIDTATNGIVAPRPPQFFGFETNNRAARVFSGKTILSSSVTSTTTRFSSGRMAG
jgi:hypothetical protein